MLQKMAVKEQSKIRLKTKPLEYKQHNYTMFIPNRCQNIFVSDIIHDGTVGSKHFQVPKLLQKLSMKVNHWIKRAITIFTA